MSDQLSTSRSRAVRLDSFGGPEVLDILDVPADADTAVRFGLSAAQVEGITPANGANAGPGTLEKLARLIATGRLRVPIAASFPVEQIRTAVELQAGRHVKGKVVIDL